MISKIHRPSSSYFLFFLILLSPLITKTETVGLCIVATGKYRAYAERLVVSAEKYFCKNQKTRYFIFTDAVLENTENTIYLFHPRLGWPFDTLKRVYAYNTYKKELKSCDYLFACDADMLFVAPVGDEILDHRVATEHPCYIHNRRGTYDQNNESTAYVSPNEGVTYFAGGFYGGSRHEFFKINSTLIEQIEKDFTKNYIALWHDESHLNRYFIDNKPTTILPLNYCFPEHFSYPKNFQPKLLALDKNHAAMRQ
jgi:histo-blood group ABO system transferase